MRLSRRAATLGLLAAASAGPAVGGAIPAVTLRDGTRLHFAVEGEGEAVVFVHGSLSDNTYWRDQMAPFGTRFRAIAYSRRYDQPNNNPPRAGYSALVDAEDLAGVIERLGAAPAHVVGHSYGALTALFLAVRRPDLLRTVTLAEPPAVALLAHLDPASRAMAADIQARMVAPMQAAFRARHTEAGVAAFIDYVRADPHAWDAFSAADKADTLKNAHEWEVMLPSGTLFPEIAPEQVAAIRTPALILSGGRSPPFLAAIDAALARLIPHADHLIFPDAGHQMWLQHPDECREAVFELTEGRRGVGAMS